MKSIMGILMVAMLGANAFAGDAVSGVNGKLGYFAGNMEGEKGQNFEGGISLPIGKSFGFQVDAQYTDVSDRDFYGLGSHLFWRNPTNGLMGITAGAIRENDVLDSWAGGVEGDYYLGRFTLGAQLGMANIDYQFGPLPFIETAETGLYALGSAGFYPYDELLLSFSYGRVLDNNIGRAQVEYQSHCPGLCFFGDVAVGDHAYDHAMLGVRYYFGQEKSLIRRHREDDPQNYLTTMLYTVGTYGAEFNENAGRYAPSSPPSSPGGPGGVYGAFLTAIGGTPSGSYGSSSSLGLASSGSYGSVVNVNYGAAIVGGRSPLIVNVPVP